jgi:hypothetical protein
MTTKRDVDLQVDLQIVELQNVLRRKRLTEDDWEQVRAALEKIEELLAEKPDLPKRSIMELQGLGAEMWRAIDVDAYLKQERDSWR